ncbi:hypothetical protein NP493_2342g00003 [Ridgeia piscesae]|uniref:DUF1907 domain-containing protein n=1 Tax=Ridgeia piscesae TaxID=27915 RepID=A0AAD9N3S8_RIDPI|nr:hypothetical protein NP493_2342g00003 [Ridgeia piscesae]
MDTNIPIQTAELYCPPLTEVAEVLQAGLRINFASATVTVVDCPDLKQEPFTLTASGLCGSGRVAELGGVAHLVPTPHKDKIYDINKVARVAGMSPGAFVLGAGAGPLHDTGFNCELVTNLLTEGANESYTIKVDAEDPSRYIQEKCRFPECCMMLNIFLSEGKGGKVLEVKAANRTGDKDIIQCMRMSLSARYGEKLMGLGGVLLLEKGKAKIHVMPELSETPLITEEDVENWMKYYEMSAPLVCLGTFVTQETNLDLRVQHFHCFSKHGDGGHFYTDTTPDDAEYLGYFNMGESLIRGDCPPKKRTLERCF